MEILCSSAFRALRHARLVTSTSGVIFVHNLALKKGVPTAQFLKKHSVPSITSNVRSYNSLYHRMYSPQTSSIKDCLKTMPPVGGWTISPLKREIVPLWAEMVKPNKVKEKFFIHVFTHEEKLKRLKEIPIIYRTDFFHSRKTVQEKWIFSNRIVKCSKRNPSSISPFVRRNRKDLERYRSFIE